MNKCLEAVLAAILDSSDIRSSKAWSDFSDMISELAKIPNAEQLPELQDLEKKLENLKALLQLAVIGDTVTKWLATGDVRNCAECQVAETLEKIMKDELVVLNGKLCMSDR